MRQGAVGGEEGSNKAGDVSEKSLQSLTVPNCTIHCSVSPVSFNHSLYSM